MTRMQAWLRSLSNMHLFECLLCVRNQTINKFDAECRLGVGSRLSAYQIHRPEAVIEFRYPKAAFRH